MSINYQFRPLTAWPVPRTKTPRRATFSAGYGRTLIDMERELAHLGAKSAVIEADCDETEIRNDGRLRSTARMRSQGVILSFVSKHGPLSYPCDTFTRWEDNLRAIVLAMAALRAVDRYGVTKRGEQYRGWKQLPGGSEPIAAAEWPNVDAAFLWLRKVGGEFGTVATLTEVYRAAARKSHPDSGGTTDLMSKVNRARDYIEQNGGVQF